MTWRGIDFSLCICVAYRELPKEYENNIIDCDFDKPKDAGKVCKVDMSSWSPCIKEKNYSYDKGTPCIFLKLNKVYLNYFLY